MNIDLTRSVVRDTYSEAATVPQPGLCCPKDYIDEWVSHIPKEAFDFNYGCGSPVLKSEIQAGEHVLDLGSGVGIDCFVAAKLVGSSGKVIGVDMTDEMLDKARAYAVKVGDTLGFHNVSFVKGHIEEIPLETDSVDVVISTCVLNLSADKAKVFSEIRRVLKPGGRVVIADIVSDREVKEADRNDGRLWADCYTGALTTRDFIRAFTDGEFVGLTQISESSWEKIAGYRFSSLTIAAYKLPKGEICNYLGNKAIYLGPYAKVEDEAGHVFPRFQPVEICTDTALQLKAGPFAGSFLVTGATRRLEATSTSCCDTGTASGCGCG
jgi:SAM-dependent methyltransferase